MAILMIVGQADAGQIVRRTIQQKAGSSDVVLVGEVLAVRATGAVEENMHLNLWEATCAVKDVIVGKSTNQTVTVTFYKKAESPMTSLVPCDRLDQGMTYVLFLKREGQSLALIDPWDSTESLSKKYDVLDGDVASDPGRNKPWTTLTHEQLCEKIRHAWQEKEKAAK